ncbi:hypothetical protein MmiAt1_07400 [Methanimicrococcus sp. At1]|uniref:Uncharacterized protein n=1 Tax=Methanimicrococcus hacksteinii TaxID=3028293 RepID=A0ABU3VP59_9EURY|nr:hypothetical protein [Methanimicrococcus sp. At1]MDV0445183.1 hypothetical protein [Methanimicrococcus sp. At1]
MEILKQNKEILNFLIFISLLFTAFILSYLAFTYEFIILFIFVFFLLLFGSILFGYFSKNQVLSAIFGFLIYPISLAGADFNNLSNLDLNFEYVLSYVFSEIMLLSVLSAAIGWLAASHLEDRDKQMFRYMAAAFLFVFYLMIFAGVFRPN